MHLRADRRILAVGALFFGAWWLTAARANSDLQRRHPRRPGPRRCLLDPRGQLYFQRCASRRDHAL